MSPSGDGLFTELKRRNVFRVAGGYVVASWLVLQVADVLLPAFGLPDEVIRYLFGALALLFPVVVGASWLLELTPEGLKLEKDLDRAALVDDARGQRMNRLIIGVLAVAVTFFVVDRFVWNAQGGPPSGPGAYRSIAVLPFADMSESGDQSWFSDGISEELLNLLARVPEFRVIARTSSFQFRGRGLDLRRVADTLGVSHILEGSVRRVGDDLRITAALIDGGDGSELWARRFDRTADDLFQVQDEIAAAVVQELRVTLTGSRMSRPEPASTRVHDLYLQGQYFADYRNLERGLELLTQSIEADPGFAPAWGKRGTVHSNLALQGALPPDSAMTLARADFARALELDPDDPITLSRQAFSLGIYDWRWREARQLMERALQLAPGQASIASNASVLWVALGQVERAAELADFATRHDPLNAVSHANRGFISYYGGDYETAAAAWETALELAPGNAFTTYRLSNARLLAGDPAGALEAVDGLSGGQWRAAALPLIYHALGRTEEAERALERLEAEFGTINPVAVAEAHAFLGHRDQAFDWLNQAYASRAYRTAYVYGNPLLDDLSGDPRFETLLDELGLPVGLVR